MAVELIRCNKCGKLYAAEPGKTQCIKCATRRNEIIDLIEEAIQKWEMKTPEEIALFVGVPVEEITRIVSKYTFLNRQVEMKRPCKRCKKRNAQTDSKFCLECRMLLNNEFNIAADTLVSRIENTVRDIYTPPESVGSSAALRSTLDRKRRLRSGSFAPDFRIR